MIDTTTERTQTPLETTLNVINTLVPLASSVLAIIGGVSIPIMTGINVVQAILPAAEKIILQFGTKAVTIDVSKANDPKAILEALNKDATEGWPALSF
jgi:hypothetical protein